MISVCMIVKDEIDVIERCINSVYEKMPNIVDEIVVVDTGSTDGTRELLDTLNCKVYDFVWCDDFSKARNFSVSKAKNDWVFIIDADEYIIDGVEEEKLKIICENALGDYVYTANVYAINNDGEVIDNDIVVRLFNRKKYKYHKIVHEQLYRIDGKKILAVSTNIILEHTGYIQEVVENKNKIEKYVKLINNHLKKYPDDMIMLGQLGEIYVIDKQYEKAKKPLQRVVFNEQSKDEMYFPNAVVSYLKCLINTDDYVSASLLEIFWENCKDNDSYLFYMADTYIETKQYEKAMDTYLSIVSKKQVIDYYTKYSYYILGNMFEQFGELEQSLKCFQSCDNFNNAEERVQLIKDSISNN